MGYNSLSLSYIPASGTKYTMIKQIKIHNCVHNLWDLLCEEVPETQTVGSPIVITEKLILPEYIKSRACQHRLGSTSNLFHNDVIKWKHFPRYWPFVRGIHRSPVNSPHKDQWRGALMFSLISIWINGWVNNREAGDLRRYRTHYDVIVMHFVWTVIILMGIWLG